MPKRYIVGEEVIEETPSVKITALHLSEEALAGLDSKGTTLELMRMDRYQCRLQTGDLVRLPDGRRGTIRMVETGVGGRLTVVSVDVENAKRRWFGLKPAIPERFADDEIDQLELIVTEEELERIGSEEDL